MKLRDYQIEISDKAVEILKEHGLVYLAMEVRTGKTLTAFATAYKYGAKKLLFVTKKKAKADIMAQVIDSGFDFKLIEVTNYEQLHNYNCNYDFVIIDEAHGLGAYPTPSVRTKELKRICENCPIVYLSGTPTPESYSQLYHQFYISSFSPFQAYVNFYKWAKDFVNLKKKYVFNRAINDYSDANKEKIDEYTKHLFISFTQEEAGFTQLVQENVVYVQMSDLTYKIAHELKTKKIIVGREGGTILADTAVKLMNKLHQVFSGTVIIDEPEQKYTAFDYTKAEKIKEMFEGKKIAIFYKFKAEKMALAWVFTDNITEDLEEFKKGSKSAYMSQIVSGREGLDISNADALIFYNIDFSATSYWQSRARIQTRDRVKDAQIYWVFAKDGIEDKIYKAVNDKKDYSLSYFNKDFAL